MITKRYYKGVEISMKEKNMFKMNGFIGVIIDPCLGCRDCLYFYDRSCLIMKLHQ